MIRTHVIDAPTADTVATATRQAARERRRGDFRRAMLLYRRAAFEADDHSGLWTRYALSCLSAGKDEEASKAFSRAIWLMQRQGRPRAAEVIKQLVKLAETGAMPRNYARSGSARLMPFALLLDGPSYHDSHHSNETSRSHRNTSSTWTS